MLKTKIFVLLSIVVIIAGCANKIGTYTALSNTPKLNTTQLDITPQQGQLVFYRVLNDTNPTAINISINGKYLSSLLSGESAQIAVCAQPIRITSAYTGLDSAYSMQITKQGNMANTQAGQIIYIRVIGDKTNQPVLQLVEARQAMQDLKHITAQTHTLPHVAKQNHHQAPTPHILNATALFDYNKSSAHGISTDDIAEISAFAKRYTQSNIVVIGYTDPVGSATYNQQLSLQRAQTVRQLLTQNGLNHQRIRAEGRGEMDLIIADCAVKHLANSQAEKQCNQPNRRVEIKPY